MSRSYKNTPVIKDKNKGAKKLANKVVRRYTRSIQNGSSYRKIFSSYDISDYSSSCTFDEYCQRYEKTSDHISYFDWYKIYKMK